MIPAGLSRQIDLELGADPNYDPLGEEHLHSSFSQEIFDISTSVHSTLISDTKNDQNLSDFDRYIGSIQHNFKVRACTVCGDEQNILIACGHRLCFKCAQVYLIQRRRYLCDKFTSILLRGDVKNHGLRFLTLTFKNVKDLEGWNDIFHGWIKSFLRSFKVNKKLSDYTVFGGCGNIEYVYNSMRDDWHIHVHLPIEGCFIPQNVIKSQWIKASNGNGKIVDIRLIKSDNKSIVSTAYEVAKYNAKPHNIHEWPMCRIIEFEKAIHGKRLFFTFGSWYNDRVYNTDPIECPKCDAIGSLVILDFLIPELLMFQYDHNHWREQNPSIIDYG